MKVLEDGDLRLRYASMDDIDFALPWYSDPEVLKYSEATDKPYDRVIVERMYGKLMSAGELFIIEISRDGEWLAIGDACLMKHSIPVVIGRREFRSRGIGKRVVSLLITHAVSLGWEEVNVKGVYSYNERSLRMFSSLGFVRTAEKSRPEGFSEISMKLDLRKPAYYGSRES